MFNTLDKWGVWLKTLYEPTITDIEATQISEAFPAEYADLCQCFAGFENWLAFRQNQSGNPIPAGLKDLSAVIGCVTVAKEGDRPIFLGLGINI